MGAAEGADDPVALTLVAVDRTDDEDVEAGTRVTGAADDEWSIADRVAEDLTLRGSLEASAGEVGRQRRAGRQRDQSRERRHDAMKEAAAHARAMPASATPCSNRSRPKAAAGPRAPLPVISPSRAAIAAQARKFPVNV